MTQAEINKKKINVAYTSVIGAIFIITVKTIATVQSGSLAVLSELFHSSTDFVASLATIIAIKYSSKPPDDVHNYGHEKVESFSALFQVFILVIMCGYIFYEAVDRIINPHELSLNIFTFSAILICIFIDFSRARALKRVAIETKSQALEADALHFSSDIWSSIVVLISMTLSKLNVSRLFDPVSAIIVALIIIYATFNITKKAFHSLMDGVPAGMAEKIRKSVLTVKEVESIESLRVRTSGSKIFVDMKILVSRLLSFAHTHGIINRVESEVKKIVPESDIVIHYEPIETNKETINEKIRLIVNDMGFKCHDIFSHKLDNEIFSEIHIEIDDIDDLNRAHEIVSEIENSILKNIPLLTKIKIHIDEPSEKIFDTTDITSKSTDLISKIHRIIDNYDSNIKCTESKIVETGGRIRVLLTCVFENNMKFDDVHDKVTTLESKIYSDIKELYPNLSNVIIHAEPVNI